MPLNQVTTMVSGQLRRHIAGYHMSKLTAGALCILTEIALAIDDCDIPIGYRRRRDLAAATLIDDDAWARMTREAGMRLAPIASARRCLCELLTSCALGTAASELDGTSETATYGPPYNNQSGSVQKLLFSPQTWFGITQPVNAAQDFVIGPLSTLASTDPAVGAPLASYRAASAAQQLKWASAYATAETKVKLAAPQIGWCLARRRLIPGYLAGGRAATSQGGHETSD
jgi:hypothetical protein